MGMLRQQLSNDLHKLSDRYGLFTLECYFHPTFVGSNFDQTFLFCLVFTLIMFQKYFWKLEPPLLVDPNALTMQ